MIISLNWLKKFTDIDLPIDELVRLIGSRLVEVESVTDLGKKYQGIVIAKVVEAGPLEGTDHLSLVKIDDGGTAKDVERDGKGLVQVVCGANNVRKDLMVAWLTPGSTVPSTAGDSEPFVLSVKNLKGTVSNGMLASPKELDLYDDHAGILEIEGDVKPGMDFAKAYELEDYLLNIENKSLTHRPDAFGIIGFAREVSAILGKEFITPDWLAETAPVFEPITKANLPLSVKISDPSICERYRAVVLSGVNANSKTPVEVQSYLARVGVRPISPVVDVTNYLMMVAGQPLHAFDYDKLIAVAGGKAEINVRLARDQEELLLLDGRTIKMSLEDIVIAAGETAVGLAGAMGGASTEIDENTKNIIIESATFNLYNLRATQMRHGIFSEAITRFTKGQPAKLTAPVLARAVELINEWTGASRVSSMVEAKGDKVENPTIELSINYVNSFLGTAMTEEQIEKILRDVEFATVASSHNSLIVSPPYWRRDIHIAEDVIEEIGRINGFDSINPSLPLRDFSPVKISEFDKFRELIRSTLTRGGVNEVLTYSFIHGDVITKSGQKTEDSYRIVNSISPDLQYYRQSLTPSMLALIHPNIKQGYEDIALYEINKVHPKQAGLDEEKVPVELDSLSLVIANKKQAGAAPYYRAKTVLEYLMSNLGVEVSFKNVIDDYNPCFTVFESKRSALVCDIEGNVLGIVGEYKNKVIGEFKLPNNVAGFELNLGAMFEVYKLLEPTYSAVGKYPGTERDVCFQVADNITYAQIVDLVKAKLLDTKLETEIRPVDIYKAEDSTTKNITIRISLTSSDHTLTSDEANGVISSVAKVVVEATDAKVI